MASKRETKAAPPAFAPVRYTARTITLPVPDPFAECGALDAALVGVAGAEMPRGLISAARSGLPRRGVNVTVRPRPAAPVGRNDPCPCGSGRKFKRCCLPSPFPVERITNEQE